tara:strand:- start:302 stop:421 length:120 start_codon:yes stop_codon:yes gene_type:complete
MVELSRNRDPSFEYKGKLQEVRKRKRAIVGGGGAESWKA